jgi:hypothetical protein
MWRKTFFGVVVAVRADATTSSPNLTGPVEVCASQKLSMLLAARILAQGIDKVLTKLAMEEKRNGDTE